MSRRTTSRREGCPVCGGAVSPAYAPFCGQGCRDRDLLQWLNEGYRIPGPAADADNREIDADGLDSSHDRPL
ncbi:DNA gyrase inhibitor YacG [Sphingomonas oleivorans]|uniref:DNA gyrase inhibitor YacG n=1 Tax=Sphingomonas oleivorans TaxID=1735121 RepID=A0A2T5FX47_9SPHN|nr:DNA gyrase inhibitor YacG [Sphingomonas oleivorans]PTQ10703.1 DNA gyrase inhibitor YacG [Sphingomonas oleivorans]